MNEKELRQSGVKFDEDKTFEIGDRFGFVCSICKIAFFGYGNNPYPVTETGRCCDDCNMIVIARRIRSFQEAN